MKKVYQKQFSSIDGVLTGDIGDCWRACVASFLGLESEQVPHFVELCGLKNEKESMDMYFSFMRDHGFHILSFNTKEYSEESKNNFLSMMGDSPFFAIGKSFKGDWLHQVIYKNGKLWHDPNGSGKGIEDLQIIEIPILINPVSQNTKSQ